VGLSDGFFVLFVATSRRFAVRWILLQAVTENQAATTVASPDLRDNARPYHFTIVMVGHTSASIADVISFSKEQRILTS